MPPPIYLNRPNALKTLSNKWSPGGELAPFLNSLGPSTNASLKAIDLERANVGQPPLTKLQTTLAGTAADTDTPQTPDQDQPWWVDAAKDIQSITTTIPKLIIPHPNNPLVKEAAAITDFLPQYRQAVSEAPGNLVETAGNIAALPGIRMLPGSFTVSQFGTGGQGIGGLTEHPVFTALDVLPYANKAARMTGTVQRAADLAEEASKATETLPRPTRPFSTLATRWSPGGIRTVEEPLFGHSGGPMVERVAPNPVGRALQGLATKIESSRAGNVVPQAFGAGSRELARLYNRATEDITSSSLKDSPHVAAAKSIFDNEMADFADKYGQLEPDRRAAVYQAVEAGDIGHLPADEQALANQYIDTSAMFREKVERPEGLVQDVEFPWGNETYDTKTATNIMEKRFQNDSQAAAAHLRDQLDPKTATRAATPDEIWNDLGTSVNDSRLSVSARQKLARGYLRALKDQGFEGVDDVIRSVTNARGKDVPDIVGQFLLNRPNYRQTEGFKPAADRITEAIPTLKEYARTDPHIADTVRSLERGDWRRANDRLAVLQKRTKFVPNVDLDGLREAVRWSRDAVNDRGSLSDVGFTNKAATKAEEAVGKAEAKAVPARLDELVRRRADDLITARLRTRADLTPEQVDQGLKYAEARAYPELEEMMPEMQQLKQQARDSWMELAQMGDGPHFVHHVSELKARQMSNPKVFDYPTTISAAKKRLWDASPAVQDLSIALNHQALEYLVNKGSTQFVHDAMGFFDDAGNFTPGLFGRSLLDVRQQYAPLATDANGILDQAKLDRLIYKDFSVFDPESFTNPRVKPAGRKPANTIVAPKEIVANLDRIKPTVKDLVPVVDPVMRLFRTSVLPLSPRWHINNILSGLILMPLRSGNPFTVWKHMAEAIRAVRHGESFDEAASLERSALETPSGRLAPPGGKTRQAGEWFRDIDTSTPEGKLAFLHNYAAGRTLGRIFKGVVQKSYDFNQAFDDFYRNMSYFEGLERATKKGAAYDDAVRAGILESRKILQNWDTLTPLERTTMRMVFPFYSWTRHVLKYVMSYPADHPWRTSFISKLAAQEQKDFDTGLPQKMMSLFFMGPTDANGKVQAINLDGMNPFRDVSNYATLGGFLASGEGDIGAVTSQFNPMITTVMRWAGMDPAHGQPELYPDLTIDPMTGSMKVATPDNPLVTAVTSFIPQTRLLTSLTGQSQQFKDLARTNPNAAGRFLASSMGLPVLGRQVDVPREEILAELRRYKEFSTVFSDTLKSGGDFGAKYPTMANLADKIRALSPEILAKYKPQPGLPGSEQPGIQDLFLASLKQQ